MCDVSNYLMYRCPVDVPLFYQPGKPGYYAPRTGAASQERLNAYRNVGRVVGLCLLHSEVMPLPLCRHVFKFLLRRNVRNEGGGECLIDQTSKRCLNWCAILHYLT